VSRLQPGAGALAEYYEWFTGAAHGAALAYHVGDLSYDRLREDTPEPDIAAARRLTDVAARIQSDARDGYLILTQKKLATSVYEYRATRVRRSHEPSYEASPTRADPIPT